MRRRIIDEQAMVRIIRKLETSGRGRKTMNESPWSAYGRGQYKPEHAALPASDDPTLGIARETLLTQEQLRKYLDRTLQEYNEIREGRAGYTRIVAEALKPPPRPESIEETLRRLSRAQSGARKRDASSGT
jgi:hypothetical protein